MGQKCTILHIVFFVIYFKFLKYFFVGVPFWLFCLGYERPIFCYVFPWFFCRENFFCVGPSRLFCYCWWRTVLESKIRIATSTYLGLSNIGFHHIHKKSSDLWHLEIDMWEDHLLHRCNNSTKIYYCPEKVPKIVHEPPTERHSGKKKTKTIMALF